MSDKSGTVVEQNDARVLRAFGEEVRIHLDGGRTAGELTIWTEITPPGGGPPPHYHLNEDETFHVLEGRIGFLLNGEWNEVGPAELRLYRVASFTRSRMSAINHLEC
jgi:quercetin dioxygenase-like cupin family protein